MKLECIKENEIENLKLKLKMTTINMIKIKNIIKIYQIDIFF